MKNKIYIILLVVGLFANLQEIIAQTRHVNWVHGMGGFEESWEHYEGIFTQERDIASLRLSYNTDAGIPVAAADVKQKMDSVLGSQANAPRNMGIGHSMGGLMIRDVDRTTLSNNKKFGGYITLCSSNYGAPIANSILNGDVTSAGFAAYAALTDGPINQLLGLPYLITPDFGVTQVINDYLSDDALAALVGTTTTTLHDLKVGSQAMTNINNYQSDKPRISIWASEDSPVHWRMFSSVKYDEDSSLSLGSTIIRDQFGVDAILPYQMNKARGVYNALMIANIALGVTSIVVSVFTPWIGNSGYFLAAYFFNTAYGWKRGRDWLDNSETIWNGLIGTTRLEIETYTENVYIPCRNDPHYADPPDCGSFRLVTRTRNVAVNYPSDGLLPQYTQELEGIPEGNKYKVNGANHIEVRDMTHNRTGDDETKEEFDDIFV